MDLQMSPFKPLHFLIDFDKLQQFQCIICTQKSINVMQCKTCKKYLCNLCAIDQKLKNNKCPYRCSKGQLELQPLLSIILSFRCPFSSQCQQKLESLKQFREHDLKCEFISLGQKQAQLKKWEFKCINDHSLEIYMDISKNLRLRKQCNECKQYKMSRVTCRKCNIFYCSDCRPFPIINMKCLIGHQFCKVNFKSETYICDLCQLSPAIVGVDFYEDSCCNIGVCQICYQGLPEFRKSPQYCENLNNYCDEVGWVYRKQVQMEQKIKQQHKLKILKSEILKQCGWCLKQRLCYKQCMKCEKYFCIECKIFEISQNGQCELEHQFYKISKEVLDSDQHISCYICKTNSNREDNVKLYKDEKCRIVLCSKCHKKSKKYNYSVTCRKLMGDKKCKFGNHAVKYYVSSNLDEICAICNKYKRIKIVCKKCSYPDKKYFCCSCYPPKLINQCYCGKILKEQKQIKNNKCLHCRNKCAVLYGCRTCSYSVCKDCINGEDNQQVIQQIV